MNIVHANTINELQKIFFKKKNLLFWTIIAIFSVGIPVSLTFFQQELGVSAIHEANYPVFILNTFSTIILPLLLFMTVSDLFVGEFEDKTLKNILFRPISRFKVFLSKNLAIIIYIFIHLFTVFLFSFATSMLLNHENLLAGFINGLKAYIIAVIPAIVISLFTVFITQLFKNSSGALTGSIFIYLALQLIAILFPSLSNALFTSYMDWHLLWLANSNVELSSLLIKFMLLLSYMIIFATAGFYLFDRKNI